MKGRAIRLLGTASLGLFLGACGADPISVDPAVEPFVGTWDAVVFTVTADEPPNTVANILNLGPFWIRIEPSGRYQGVLEFAGGQTEFGRVIVHSSSSLSLDADNAAPAVSTYVFATADSLVLDGPTEFDFNLDGTDEAAQAHIEIVRR